MLAAPKKAFGFKIGLFLLITNGGRDTVRLVGTVWNPSENGWCTVQGTMYNFFSLSFICWIFTVGLIIISSISESTPYYKSCFCFEIIVNEWRKQRICYFFIINSVIFPLLSLLPITTDTYDDTGGWCWLSPSTNTHDIVWHEIWGILICYLYIFMAILLFAVSIFLFCKIESNHHEKRNTKTMLKYLIFAFLLWICSIIRRSYEWHTNHEAPTYLQIMHVIGQGSIGIWIFIFYVKINCNNRSQHEGDERGTNRAIEMLTTEEVHDSVPDESADDGTDDEVVNESMVESINKSTNQYPQISKSEDHVLLIN